MLPSSKVDAQRRVPCAAATLFLLSALEACIEVPVEAPPTPYAAEADEQAAGALATRPPTAPAEPSQSAFAPGSVGDREPAENDVVLDPAHDGGVDVDVQTSAPPEPTVLSRGDVVITEIMADPSQVRDEDGEWIELYNRREQGDVELSNCSLADGSDSERAIRQPFSLRPGEYVTIARSEQPGFTPDLVMAFSLANAADAIALSCNGKEIDRVEYDATFSRQSGASLSLDPAELDAARNDRADAWCKATSELGGDFGSPGKANPPCAEAEAERPAATSSASNPPRNPPSSSSTAARPPATKPPSSRPPSSPPPAPAPDDEDEEPALPVNTRQPRIAGQLVITEFMADPSAVPDAQGEWLELYNTGLRGDVDLRGCTLDDGSATPHPISESVPVPAGAYATLGRGTSSFAPDWILSFSLANSTDSIALLCDGVEIDRIDYDASFGFRAGASSALDPNALNATDNDLASHWCTSTMALGSEFGSPGVKNAPCESPAAEPPPEVDEGANQAPALDASTPDAPVETPPVPDAGTDDVLIAPAETPSEAEPIVDAGAPPETPAPPPESPPPADESAETTPPIEPGASSSANPDAGPPG